jgi:hypothetical protein
MHDLQPVFGGGSRYRPIAANFPERRLDTPLLPMATDSPFKVILNPPDGGSYPVFVRPVIS